MMSGSARLEVETGNNESSVEGHHQDEGNLSCGRGVKRDFNRRVGTHWKEEMTNLSIKTIGVSIFIFIAAVAPAITFGAVYAKSTNNYIGAVEMVCFLLHVVLFAPVIDSESNFSSSPFQLFGQMINGGTGPVLAVQTVLYEMSLKMEVPFLTLNAWTGIWLTILLVLAAFVNLNRIMKHLTRFTDEIFAMRIASIFILDAIGNPFNKIGVAWYFMPGHKSHDEFRSDPNYNYTNTAFLSLMLTFGTCSFAFYLRKMKHSHFLPNQTIRNIICDFAVFMSLLFWCIIGNVLFSDIKTETLNVPEHVRANISMLRLNL